jgi:hypothetical protein
MYGVGDVNVANPLEEHTGVPDLMTAAKTVALLIVDWCGVGAGTLHTYRTFYALFAQPRRRGVLGT